MDTLTLHTLYPTCILIGIFLIAIVSSWIVGIILATYISRGAEREDTAIRASISNHSQHRDTL